MLCVAGTPLNLPASLPPVPRPVESKDGSFSVLMAGHMELFSHSGPDFPHFRVYYSVRVISC